MKGGARFMTYRTREYTQGEKGFLIGFSLGLFIFCCLGFMLTVPITAHYKSGYMDGQLDYQKGNIKYILTEKGFTEINNEKKNRICK